MEGEEDLDYECILIYPPEVSEDTDVDGAEEDEGGKMDHLSDNQLSVCAELAVRDGRRIRNDKDLENPLSPAPKEDLSAKPDEQIPFPSPDFEEFKNLSAIQFFELFFDNEVMSLLLNETINYARFKHFPELNVTMDEFKCFFGILLLSGFNFPSRRRYYWDDYLLRNEYVASAMTHDRFEEILRSVHCCDNRNLNKDDLYCKVRPLADLLKQRFLKHFKPTCELSYDYFKIEYYGKHGCYQRVRLMNRSYGYPKINIEFGYETKCLNDKDGYLINFEFYQKDGDEKQAPTNHLERLLSDFSPDLQKLPFCVYYNYLYSRNGPFKVEKKSESPIVFKYTERPSSTDSMARKLVDYGIGIRTRKWWWSVFSWLVNISFYNAYLLMRKSGRKMSRTKFYTEVVKAYIDPYRSR